MVSESVLENLRTGKSTTMNLSFAGCGFLGIYHVGVASCIKEYAPHLAADKIAGASAGAIAAAGLVCDCDLGEATTQVLQVALKARSYTLGPLHPTFSILDFVRGLLDDFLPFNAHKLASGRVHISLTRMSDRNNVIISQYDTREDLIQVLLCSAYIPFYCGLIPPKYKGTYYLDGGLSNNIPILDDQTITVSPFAGESDICPKDLSGSDMHFYLANTSIQVSSANLYRFGCIVFPPSPETLSKMCQQGFDDCLTFLRKNNLISCARHLSIYTSITSASSEPFEKPRPFVDRARRQKISAEVAENARLRCSENLDQSDASGPEIGQSLLTGSAVASQASEGYANLSDSRRAIFSQPEMLSEESSLLTTISSASSLESWCSEDESEGEEEGGMHYCEECAQRRTLAVPDSLPTPVVRALKAACDSVNSGLWGYLNRMRMFRVLSLMAAPATIPMEVTYSLTKRFAEWVPYMPEDMQWFVQEFLNMLWDSYKFVQSSRHRYSARFTCQLAITEHDFTSDSSPNRLKNIRPQTLPIPSKRHLNVGFSLDIESSGHTSDPIECVDELRHRLLEGDNEVYLHQLPPTECTELESEAILDSPLHEIPYAAETTGSGTRSRPPSGDFSRDFRLHTCDSASSSRSRSSSFTVVSLYATSSTSESPRPKRRHVSSNQPEEVSNSEAERLEIVERRESVGKRSDSVGKRSDSVGKRWERRESVGKRSERSDSVGKRSERRESVGKRPDSDGKPPDSDGKRSERRESVERRSERRESLGSRQNSPAPSQERRCANKHHHHHQNSHFGTDTGPSGTPTSGHAQTTGNDVVDTFENCLHIAEQMDAILSYYYTEENNPNVIRVAEIYPLCDSRGPEPENTIRRLTSARESLLNIAETGVHTESDVQ